MKIGRQPDGRQLTPARLRWLGALLIFAAGVFLGHRGLWPSLLARWHDATAVLSTNAPGSLPTFTIDMSFSNYNAILAQREQALADGVFIAAETDFQPADVTFAGETIPVRLRLRQGTAVHLGDDNKWNFDLRTRDDHLLAGMQRAYLIDPADNNWLHEWAFQEALRREGVLATPNQFVRLVLNGADRGVYALQAGFGPELPTTQSRPPGPIVEYDATRLWQALAAAGGNVEAATADPVTNLTAADFRFFEVDTFRDAAFADDPVLAAQRDAAIGLLRGLQSGQLTAAELFDVEKYGRFLALADLWGAAGAVELVNLRYYYHPDTGKLEPIGFNAAPTPADPGRRISLAQTYGDSALQAATVQALAAVSQPDYLAGLEADLDAAWQAQNAQLPPAQRQAAPWAALAERQALLRQSLQPDQPVFAYLGAPERTADGVIQVDLANVLNLPVEILGFDIDGATFLEADRAWLQGDWQSRLLADENRLILKPVAPETAVLPYLRFHLPLAQILAQDAELDFNQEPVIRVATRLWGMDDVQLTPARVGYPEPFAQPAPAADQE